jgi:hypothetical protein
MLPYLNKHKVGIGIILVILIPIIVLIAGYSYSWNSEYMALCASIILAMITATYSIFVYQQVDISKKSIEASNDAIDLMSKQLDASEKTVSLMKEEIELTHSPRFFHHIEDCSGKHDSLSIAYTENNHNFELSLFFVMENVSSSNAREILTIVELDIVNSNGTNISFEHGIEFKVESDGGYSQSTDNKSPIVFHHIPIIKHDESRKLKITLGSILDMNSYIIINTSGAKISFRIYQCYFGDTKKWVLRSLNFESILDAKILNDLTDKSRFMNSKATNSLSVEHSQDVMNYNLEEIEEFLEKYEKQDTNAERILRFVREKIVTIE